MRVAARWILILLIPVLVAAAEDPVGLRMLDVRAAQLEVEKRKGDLDRALELKEKGLISEQDFAGIRTSYLESQVTLQQSIIRRMGGDARITLESAVKYQSPDGRKLVRAAIRYTSRETADLEALGITSDDPMLRAYFREVRDVYVSLRAEGRILSDPYQIHIESLRAGERRELTFQLLKDVESLDVCVSVGTRDDITPVYLQKGVSSNVVTVSSARFSQEADLEKEADFDLSLEKFSGDANTFKLRVANLPASIQYEFMDPQTQTRLSQIKFTEGVTRMNLTLKLYLPRNPDDEVVLDRPLELYVLVLGEGQEQKVIGPGGGTARSLTDDDIRKLNVGAVKLELIPRGVGRIEVEAANLYHEIKTGQSVEMEMTVRNSGTRAVRNVRVSAELPLGWHATITPSLLPSLEQNQQAAVKVALVPESSTAVGDYEPRIKTECYSGSSRVESEEKTVRIHIENPTNLLGMAVLVVLLLGLLAGTVFFGIRMARR